MSCAWGEKKRNVFYFARTHRTTSMKVKKKKQNKKKV